MNFGQNKGAATSSSNFKVDWLN